MRCYLRGMRGAFGRCAVLLGLWLGVAGCGGGEGGPRGGKTGGTNGAAGGTSLDPNARPSLRTVVYLPTYRGNLANWTAQLRFSQVSYVNLSFVEVSAEGVVTYPDAGLSSFVARAHEAGAKVCIALGGAATIEDGGVFTKLLTDEYRPLLVDNLVKFTKDNQLDCLDIDLEGNGVNSFYEAFVTELADQLKPDGIEITAAVAGWFGDRITDKALHTFDFVNVMAYDLYISRHTPMQTASIEAATSEVDKWVARGLPREKVVYGVPFYGFQWPNGGGEPETLGYGDLLRRDPAAATQDQLQGPATVIYLNSRATIQAKAVLAKTYGGIMAWELGQDADGEDSLLHAIHEAVP